MGQDINREGTVVSFGLVDFLAVMVGLGALLATITVALAEEPEDPTVQDRLAPRERLVVLPTVGQWQAEP